MSKRRCKHVLHSALQDEVQPPLGRQSIVRALGSRGGNHVEVCCSEAALLVVRVARPLSLVLRERSLQEAAVLQWRHAAYCWRIYRFAS